MDREMNEKEEVYYEHERYDVEKRDKYKKEEDELDIDSI